MIEEERIIIPDDDDSDDEDYQRRQRAKKDFSQYSRAWHAANNKDISTADQEPSTVPVSQEEDSTKIRVNLLCNAADRAMQTYVSPVRRYPKQFYEFLLQELAAAAATTARTIWTAANNCCCRN